MVIGGIGPTTGAAADYGINVRNGAMLAIKEINAAGGVNGITLELAFEDDEHDAEKAVNAYNSLKDKNMKALVGAVTSKPCIAVSAEANKDNMFLLTPSGSAVECTSGKDNAFRLCFNDPNQGSASAKYIKENNMAEKVAVIYNSSDPYSSGIYDTFKTEADSQGLEIVSAEAFTDDSSTDFSVQLQKIKQSGAELVFLPIYYEAAALILNQANVSGLDVAWFGCDGLDGIIPQLGDNASLAEGVMLLTPFVADATDDMTQKFVNAYKSEYGSTPTQFAADGYDCIYTIKLALEQQNISDVANMSASDLCNKLKVAMVEIELTGLTGTITWDSDGEPSKDAKAMKIVQNGVDEDGKPVYTYSAM